MEFILINYIYILNIQNCDNVTMYYYMHFTTLVHVMYYVFSLHVSLNLWPNVTGALLLWLAQSVLTYTGQPLTVGKRESHEHVAWDHVTLVSPMIGKYTVLTTTHAQCMVYCIQYYDCIIKSWYNICNGIEVVIFLFLLLLFLNSLYDKNICPVLTVCWHLNIIQCSAMSHVSIPNGWCRE